MIDVITAILWIGGAVFALLAALGVVRMPDVFTRMQASTKASTLGYRVAFVPFEEGKPAGRYEDFAAGFAGVAPLAVPTAAPHRPMGVTVGPDGALYVSDDVRGKIWRITYSSGNATSK